MTWPAYAVYHRPVMMSSLRRWFKTKGYLRLPFLPPRPASGRFLAFSFADPSDALSAAPNERKYYLYMPQGARSKDSLPLIVMLHGCSQNAEKFAQGTRMNEFAEGHRCAVLYPEQNPQANPLGCWNWFELASTEGHGEAALLARLIESVSLRRRIDSRRVYLVGMSAGGAMASILAVRHSRLFAGCAIHSGLMYGAADSPLQAVAAMKSGPSPAAFERAQQRIRAASELESTVPTLVIHGDCDTIVNPVNADQIIAQLQARALVIEGDALLPSPERRIESRGSRAYLQQDYLRGGRIIARKILVEGLGHAWSGGNAAYDFNDAAGPDASRLIVDFLTSHSDAKAALARAS
jgi:poly(hydroxyalkanoate) depolymerase family esterase